MDRLTGKEPMETERINRIATEETLHLPKLRDDTPEEAVYRQRVRQEIDAIKEQGKEVQLPNE